MHCRSRSAPLIGPLIVVEYSCTDCVMRDSITIFLTYRMRLRASDKEKYAVSVELNATVLCNVIVTSDIAAPYVIIILLLFLRHFFSLQPNWRLRVPSTSSSDQVSYNTIGTRSCVNSARFASQIANLLRRDLALATLK